MSGESEPVTRGELAMHLAPLGEMRDMFRASLGRVEKGQERILSQIAEMDIRITRRQDITNGRTAKVENLAATIHISAVEAKAVTVLAQQTAIEAKEAVGVAQQTAIEAKEAASGAAKVGTDVQAIVAHIDQFGCRQKGRHEDMVDALVQAGVTPGEATPITRWTRRQKGSMGAGLAAATALGALTPYLVPAVEHLARWVRSW
jgi:hypothetical protein